MNEIETEIVTPAQARDLEVLFIKLYYAAALFIIGYKLAILYQISPELWLVLFAAASILVVLRIVAWLIHMANVRNQRAFKRSVFTRALMDFWLELPFVVVCFGILFSVSVR